MFFYIDLQWSCSLCCFRSTDRIKHKLRFATKFRFNLTSALVSPATTECFFPNRSAFSSSARGCSRVPGLDESPTSAFKCWHAFELKTHGLSALRSFPQVSQLPSTAPCTSGFTDGVSIWDTLFNHQSSAPQLPRAPWLQQARWINGWSCCLRVLWFVLYILYFTWLLTAAECTVSEAFSPSQRWNRLYGRRILVGGLNCHKMTFRKDSERTVGCYLQFHINHRCGWSSQP